MKTFQTLPAAQNVDMVFAPLSGAGQVQLSSTPKFISPFAGVVRFVAWLRRIGFYERVAEGMPFAYSSPNAFPLVDTFSAFIFSVLLGASRFAHCDWLRFDKALHALLGVARFPGGDAVLRFFARFSQGAVEAFFRPLTKSLLALLRAPKGGFSLDLDSTVFLIARALRKARRRAIIHGVRGEKVTTLCSRRWPRHRSFYTLGFALGTRRRIAG